MARIRDRASRIVNTGLLAIALTTTVVATAAFGNYVVTKNPKALKAAATGYVLAGGVTLGYHMRARDEQ